MRYVGYLLIWQEERGHIKEGGGEKEKENRELCRIGTDLAGWKGPHKGGRRGKGKGK